MPELHPEPSHAPLPPPGLTISPLGPGDVTAAYTLAHWAKPDLAPERWENFLCDWRADPDGRGILIARNRRGGILGFVCWWRQPDLDHGEIIWAGPFCVREMGVRPLVREALEAELLSLANSMRAGLCIAPEVNAPHSLRSDNKPNSDPSSLI